MVDKLVMEKSSKFGQVCVSSAKTAAIYVF